VAPVSLGTASGGRPYRKTGPFKSSAGNYYQILGYGGTAVSGSANVQAWKSSSLGGTWAEISTGRPNFTNASNPLLDVAVVQIGDVLHIVYHARTFWNYVQFNMSTDTWGSPTTPVSGMTTQNWFTLNEVIIDIVARSDGSLVVAYSGPTYLNMTYYPRTALAVRSSGGTWTTGISVQPGNTDKDAALGINLAVDSNNLVTVAWQWRQQWTQFAAFSTSNVLSASVIPSSVWYNSGTNSPNWRRIIAANRNGTPRILVAMAISTDNVIQYISFDAANPPPSTATYSFSALNNGAWFVTSTTTTNHAPWLSLNIDSNGVQHLVHIGTTGDIRRQSSGADNDTWTDHGVFYNSAGTAASTSTSDGTAVRGLSSNVIGSGSAEITLAIAFNDNGTNYVDTYQIQAAQQTGDSLTAAALASGTAVIGTPALTQNHVLTANAVVTGAPVIATPAITQNHSLSATAVATGLASLGTPALTSGPATHVLTATALASGTASIGTPAISQKHIVTGNVVATGPPVIGAAVITQNHALSPNAVVTGSAFIGSPALSVGIPVHALTASPVVSGDAVIVAASLSQRHNISANSLITGPPVIGEAVLTQLHALVGTGLVTGSSVIGTPLLTHIEPSNLPVSLSGLFTGVAPAGPFKSGDDDIFLIGRDTTTATLLRALKGSGSLSSFGDPATPTISLTSNIIKISAYKELDTVRTLQVDTSPGVLTGYGIGQTTGTERLAEALTAASSFVVDEIEVALFKIGTPTDNVEFELRLNNITTGTVLATFSMPAALVTGASTPYRFKLSSPVQFDSGDVYYLIAKRSGAIDASNYVAWAGTASSTHSGSQAYRYAAGWVQNTAGTVEDYAARYITYDNNPNRDLVHIVVAQQNGTSSTLTDYRYVTYDLSTETWGTPETIQTGINAGNTNLGGVASREAHIVVRSTGEVIVLYNGASVINMGNPFASVKYARRATNGTWTTAVALDPAVASTNYTAQGVALGDTERVHFLYDDGNGVIHRSLDSSNTLQANSTVITPATGSFSLNQDFAMISYLGQGSTRIVAAVPNGGNNAISTISFYTAGATINYGDARTGLGSAEFPLRLYHDGTDLRLLFRGSSDSDLYVMQSTDHGLTFGAPVSAFAATVAANQNNLSEPGASGDVYQRGTAVVIPYAVNDNGTWKYNEYVLRTIVSTSLTASPIATGLATIGTPALTEQIILQPLPVVTGAAALGTPAITQNHTLTANSLSSGLSVLGTPSLTPRAVLTANSLTSGASVVGSPALVATSILTANPVATSAAFIGSPVLTHRNLLTATALATSPAFVGSAVLSQNHSLTATAVQSSAAVVGSAVLSQNHSLAATSVSTGLALIGSAVLAQSQALTATAISTGLAVIGTGVLSQNHSLTATAVQSSTVIGTGVLSQKHVLTATAVQSSAVIGSAVLSQKHALSILALATSVATLGTPILTVVVGTDVLTASPLASGLSTIGLPALTPKHVLTGNALATSLAVLGTPLLTPRNILTANALATGLSVLGTPALVHKRVLTALPLASGLSTLGTPALTRKVVLTANALATGLSTIGLGSLTQKHILTATALATGLAVITLGNMAGTNIVTALPLTTGASVIGVPAISQKHVVTANAVVTGLSTIGLPAISQKHVLAAAAVVSSTVLGQPAISQKHILTATALASGLSVIGLGNLAGSHTLAVLGINTNAATIGLGAFSQKHVLTANSLISTTDIGLPLISQKHSLSVLALATSLATIGTPSLAQILPSQLVPVSVVTGSAVLGTAVLTQRHILSGLLVVSGAPVIGTAVFQGYAPLTANAVNTGPAVLGSPLLSQRHSLLPEALTANNALIGLANFGQTHTLEANYLTTDLAQIGSPILLDLLPWTPVQFTELVGIIAPDQLLEGRIELEELLTGIVTLEELLTGRIEVEQNLLGNVETQLLLTALIWIEGFMADHPAYSQEVTLHAGASKRLRFACVDPEGNPVAVGLGATGKWWAAKHARVPEADVPLKVEGTVETENGQSFLIVDIIPADTVAMMPLNYYHEGEIYDGPNVYTVASGTLILKPSLVR
jgi:hypothetical protein